MDPARPHRLLLALAGLCALISAGLSPAQAPSPQEPVVHTLFDGSTLRGWEGDPRFWSVEDGTLVGRSTAEVPCNATTYLAWTGPEFGDFDLELEFLIRGGNSGVQVRSERGKDWQVTGYQADIEDGPNWTGCIYEQGGRGVMVRRGELVRHASTGEVTRSNFADGEVLLRAMKSGDWNRYRILARGARIELWLNGVRMCALEDRNAERARRTGRLALQLHAGPPMEVRYRNLRLRELPRGEARTELVPTGRPAAAPEYPAALSWIWIRKTSFDNESVLFRKGFTVPAGIRRARLVTTCDDAVKIWLDGKPVLSGTEWRNPVEAEVTEHLREPGRHLLAARGTNEGGPAGFLCVLELDTEDGAQHFVVSDSSWRTSTETDDENWRSPDFDDSGWGAAVELATLSRGAWGRPGILGDDRIVFEAVEGDPDMESDAPVADPPSAPVRTPRWPAGGKPHWIWLEKPAGAKDIVFFRRAFTVREGLARATLSATCDNVMQVFVGGAPVAESTNWAAPIQVDVTRHLTVGRNLIAARGENQGAPAGLLAVLELEYADGSREAIVTDPSWLAADKVTGDAWRASDFDDKGWRPAVDCGGLGSDPWGTPGLFDGTVSASGPPLPRPPG